MTNIIPLDQARGMLPQRMQDRMLQGQSMNSSFSDGVRDTFPVLSIRGKVFRVRVSGDETPLIDPNTRQPVPFLDIVLVAGSQTLSKAYYQKGFTEGDFDQPTCWSLDSFKPDPSVANKMSVTCQNCPMNEFGSRVTDNGKKAKACQDARRVAVVMPHQLSETQQMMLLLRIPQSSLKNLKNYAQLLERNGIDASGCITRIAFDYQEAFPKLLFNFVAPLGAQQYDTVLDLAAAEMTQAMLMAPDFDPAPSAQPQMNASTGVQGLPAQAPPVLAPKVTTTPAETFSMTAPVMQSPVMAAAKQAAAESAIITLPDGRLYDRANGRFVEPEPVIPEDNSHLIKLPDGKTFNTKTGAYVEEPQAEVKTKKPPAKKEKIPALPQVAQPQEDVAEEDTKTEMQAKDENPNAVKPAPASMESLLTKLVPTLN